MSIHLCLRRQRRRGRRGRTLFSLKPTCLLLAGTHGTLSTPYAVHVGVHTYFVSCSGGKSLPTQLRYLSIESEIDSPHLMGCTPNMFTRCEFGVLAVPSS